MPFPYSFSGTVAVEPDTETSPGVLLTRVIRSLQGEGAVLIGGSDVTARIWIPPVRRLGLNLDFTAPISWILLRVDVQGTRAVIRFRLTFGRLLLLATFLASGFLLLNEGDMGWAAGAWGFLVSVNYAISAGRAYEYIRKAAADQRITHVDKQLILGRSAT